ncbi:DUF2341 domain-containing protein [Geobacter sp. DSM 9736]|uniref:DUF2341 domain-containing protein n=1 Tax=Geobacter sp. DSM 9736 TaxID=1277350 RepID=UPI000B60B82D|nr:DUF2341 domain-containing protein [Geobacter sp. DSM 9736]SNB46427.1 delta-60 repeat domain-containing protein [Geobacter sp. DSM 9736]
MRQDVHSGAAATTRKGARTAAAYLTKLLLAGTLLLISAFPIPSWGAGGDVVWQAGDILTGKQEPKASATDTHGNVIIAGYQNISGGINDDFYTVKFKADGSGIAWRSNYDRAGGSDQATAVIVDKDNNVVVTGFAWNGQNNDVHTVKYDGATGAVLWQHAFNGVAKGNDIGTSLAVDSLNNVYVGGYSQDGNGNNTFLILKYTPAGTNPDGTPAWQIIADGATTGINRVNSITTGAGGVAVTGQTWGGGAFESLTIKYDYSGVMLWERRHFPAPANSCIGKLVKMDAAGNVVMTGSAYNGIDQDIYTVNYDGATGEVLWERTYNGAFDDEANGLAIGPNGNVYITGYTWTLTAQNDFYTAKYNGSTGALVWERNFNSTNGNDDMTAATGIVIDPNGDVFVTGYTVADKNFDWQTVKYKKDNGNQLWHRSFNGASNKNDRPIGIGLSPAGEVLVAGWTDTPANELDTYIIKYDPGLLDPPTSAVAQATTDTSVGLTWVDNSSNEDGFSIERCQNHGCTSFAEIATTAAGASTYSDSGLAPNTYYSYRVRAFSAAGGYSHYSNTGTALTVVVTFTPPADSRLYNGLANLDDFANAIAVGPDNNPVVAGQTNDYPVGYTQGVHSFDYLALKLNHADMSQIWSKRYDGTGADDIATCIAVDKDNSVVVSGYATLYNGETRDVNSLYTIRYPLAGEPVGDQYNGPVPGGATDDRAAAVAIASAADTSNNVVVVGYGKNAADNDDIYVLKYNQNGTRAWAAFPFDGAGGDDLPTSVLLAADGDIFVTGYSEKSPGSNVYNFFTAKYSGATGAKIWSDVYSVTPAGDNRLNAIGMDAAGDVYVTGSAVTADGTSDFYTIKYSGTSSTAQRIWTRSMDGGTHGADEAVAVKIDPVDGSILIAGTTLSGPGDHDFTLVRYSTTGSTVFEKTYLRPGNDDIAKALAVDSNGNAYLAGNTSNALTTDSLTVKFDYVGNLRSATLYNGAANSFDETTGAVANSADEIFIAGYSENASANADFLIYKIAPDTSVPSVPYGITGVSGYASVALSWSDRSTVKDGFRLERKIGTCSTLGQWEAAGLVTGSSLSFAEGSLNTGTTYCYRIQSFVNGSSVSRWAEKEITTLSPASPSNVTAIANDSTRVALNWADPTSGETGFRIERCTGADCSDFLPVATASANSTTYTDTSACHSTIYRYRVIAFGDGWASRPGMAAAPATTSTPRAPVLTATRVSEAEISLSWIDTNSDEGGFVVERCSGENCTGFAQIAQASSGASTYRDTGLTAGTSYSYRIKAYKNGSCSWELYSNTASATTTLTPPTDLSAIASSTTSVNLSWSDNTASETGFSIEKCIGNNCDNFSEIGTAASATSSYTDISACTSETATYRVRANRAAVGLSNSGDGCWTKRAPLTISGFQPNLQMKLTIPYDPDMLPSFNDVRFMDSSAGIELPYWIETKTDGVSATVWVKTGMNNSLHLYYGNPLASSSSNGTGVFEFFDDFSGTTLDGTKWGATGGHTVNNGTLRVNTGSVFSKATVASTPQNRVYEMKSQYLTGAASFSGINIANASSTQPGNAGANALAYFVSDSGASANLLPFAATGTVAAYNIVTGSVSSTVSTGGALYNPFTSNYQSTRKPAAGFWFPPAGGNITRIHVKAATESCCDVYRVYNASGVLIGEYRGSVDMWVDVAPTTGIYSVFQTDVSYSGGFGGDVPEVAVVGANATGQLNTYRIAGYEFQDTSRISFFVRSPDYSDSFRNTFTGTWNHPNYLWLGYYTGAAAGTTDIDDIEVDWVRVRKYSATEPAVAIGAADASDCFTFGTSWEASYTNTATATTPAPGTPSLTARRVSEVQVDLSWADPTSDESGYKVERCSGEVCTDFSPIAIRPAGTTTYSDTGLTPGAAYTYRVKGYKSAPCPWETISNAVIQTASITGPSTVASAAVDTTKITLTWANTSATETGFVVERCEGPGCTDFAPVGTPAARSTTFSDTTVCSGHAYSFRIKAVKVVSNVTVWESPYSDPVVAVTPAFTNLVADASFEKTPSGWTGAVGTLNGTSIDSSTAHEGVKSLKLVASGVTLGRSQTVTVNPGRSYVLSGWINTLLTGGKAQCNISGTGISSSGIASTGNSSGWINRSETIAIPAGTTAVAIRCFADTTPYGTAWFDDITFTPVDFPLAATAVNELSVTLSWPDSVTDETGYKIERCAGEGCSDFAQINSTNANVGTYTDGGRTPNVMYRYRVKGYKNSACFWESAYSNVSEAVTMPPAPLNLNAVATSTTQVNLTWADKTASETGFEVERCVGVDCTEFTKINTTGANATSYPDSSVSSGTTYRYRVRAVSSTAGWTSSFSNEKTITTSTPGAPTLHASVTSETQVSLTWNDPTTDESGYRVYRCSGTGCSDFTLVTTLPANSIGFNDTGRAGNMTYVYRIEGFKSGTAGWTTTSNSITAITTPQAPTGLAVTAVDTTQAKLTWTNRTTSETGISIERCQGSGCSNFSSLATVGTGTTSFYDTTLCNSQPASYRIQAINTSATPWTSDYSGTVSITIPAPSAPSELTATSVNEKTIAFSWTDNTTDESGFRIERCEGPNCTSFSQVATVLGNVRSYSDATLSPNASYRYQVRAYKAPSLGCAWNSDYSNIAENQTLLVAPSPVTADAANSTKVVLNWVNKTVSENGYRIERCTGAECSDFQEIVIVPATASSWSDTTVTSATSYSYRIRATCSAPSWDSPYSAIVSATTPAQGPPTNLAAVADTTRVTLTWADNTADETGFKIERCTGADCTGFIEIAQTSANVTTYNDDTACNATTYRYRIRATSTTVGYDTAYSNTVTSMTLSPEVPVLTASRISESQINLTWTDPTGDETGYKVERCIGAGCSDFSQIAGLGSSATTYADPGLVPGYTYTYRVKSYKTATCPWETSSSTATATTNISAPTGLVASAIDTTRITLSWTDTNTSKTGFRIDRCTASDCSNFNEVFTTTGTSTTWSDTSVASGTSYSYRVRATRSIPYAWNSDYSNIASAMTPAPQAPTELIAAESSSSEIRLTWKDNASDETGYRLERCTGANCLNFAEVDTVSKDVSSYSSQGLAPSTTYCYRVRAYKTAAYPWVSSYSNISCAVTVMVAPDTLSASALNSFSIKLNWVDSSIGENGFNIEQQIWNGEWVLVSSVGANATDHIDTIGIEPQKTYKYRISAFRGNKNTAYSNVATVTTPEWSSADTPCPAPQTDTPVISSAPVTAATENVPYTYQVVATATGGGALSFALPAKPAGMAVSDSGLITWIPTYDDAGNQNVTVRVTDGSGRSTDQNFTILVESMNRKPAIQPITSMTAVENHPLSYQISAADPDGDEVIYSLTSAPSGMTISPSGFISWTPGSSDIGPHEIIVKVTDGNLDDSGSFSVNVSENHQPAITSLPITTASEGIVYSYQVTASDFDGDGLSFALAGAPAGMTVSGNGLISWAPTGLQVGENPVTLTASDGSLAASQTFIVTVSRNHYPLISSTPVTTAAEGEPYTYAVTASDSDADSISFSLKTAPSGMSISVAGVISWTPDYNQAGSQPVTVRVTDARTLYVEQNYVIEVADLKRPPVISSTPKTTCPTGIAYAYQVVASDPEGLPVSYALSSAPSGMTVSTSGLVTWAVPSSGSHSVTLEVSDAYRTTTQTFTLLVAPAPGIPTTIPHGNFNSSCTSTAVTVAWNAVTGPDSHPVQYAVELNNVVQPWQSGTSLTFTASAGSSQTWRVKSKDAVTGIESGWSSAETMYDDACCDCTCTNSCGGSSCPLVYSWNGGYRYETDLQGPAISQIKKGSRNVYLYQPSYIVLEAGLIPDENNLYKVKIWESLQEASLIDEARLLAVDYPEGYQIVSSGAENTYYYGYSEPFRLYTIKDPVSPVSAIDKHGDDVLSSLIAVDDNRAPMNPDDPDNFYTLDFGTIQHPEYAKLVIDGWQDINSKIYLSTIQIQPYVEVLDASGAWVKVKSFGMPAGDLKTMVVDLSNKFLTSDHRVRVHLGIKKAQVWVIDRIRLDDSAPVAATIQQLQASSADLQYGGHAIQSMVNRDHRLIATDEAQPLKPTYFGYGMFTRYGEVASLVTQRDDKYVLMNYADRLELTYPVPLPPKTGMQRGFVLMVDNYYKEFKDYKYLEPLPFHGMSDYPYPATESYPTDDDHNQYRLLYNTREFKP